MQGQLRYRGFDTTIELDVVRRQEGTDPAALRFKETLDHLRDGEVTYEDWRLLASRVQSQVPEDVARFKDALRIYSTTDRVLDYNFGKLRDLNRPVLKVNSLNNCPHAAQASTEDAGNLQATLFLSIGAPCVHAVPFRSTLIALRYPCEASPSRVTTEEVRKRRF